MNAQEAQKRLESMRAGARREALVASGAYDGRYRSRMVEFKRHKEEKHKKRLMNEFYSQG